ncbi:LOW QUALITY PROTEIN: hypothetical protein Cgig2_018344 [Carnegiea gigantea]|uniref:Reverse transcriptase zinc-binding domain-containing protein n=1 Tax=Carnegiea gigantea TaxID=171969 RepID=A0A9Q1QTG7_9CARY|nr:LOW QUALITY PROTEIN: hypothetical protein Cgig2_018344 [Carnegiea gigantea]
MSDHLPILLKCAPCSTDSDARRKRFMFENMWLTDSSCRDTVCAAWSSVSSSHTVENMLYRLEKCVAYLMEWNQSTFGHVGQKIRDLEQQLRTQRDAIIRHQMLGLIRDWRKKEEILWWQRACSDYLKFGDSNTRWFHSWANTRKKKNTIAGLKDANAWANLKVCNLIDHDSGCWRTELVHQIFLNCDAELFLSISLCNSWPSDKLIWHYHSQGIFTVRSAYHMLASECQGSTGFASVQGHSLWRAIWCCNVPPRIRLFGWRAATRSLPSADAVARRIPSFAMNYSICGHDSRFHSLANCLENGNRALDTDHFDNILSVMWEYWKTRNRFIFWPERSLRGLGNKAIDFVASYRRAKEETSSPLVVKHQDMWQPPMSGFLKLNFDGASIDNVFTGWDFVLRNHSGDVLLAGAKHNIDVAEPIIEEAKSCPHALKYAFQFGASNIIVEGDCLPLINMLKSSQISNTTVASTLI